MIIQNKLPIEALQEALTKVVPNTEWQNSHPFLRTLHGMSSKKKGAIGEVIIEKLWGNIVKKRNDSSNDRIINGKLVEVKFSMKWENKTEFKWQQFRPEQNPDYYLCFGVFPDNRWFFYTFPSSKIYKHLGIQHGGKSALKSNTYWLNFDPINPPTWSKDEFDQDGTSEVALKTIV